MLQVNDISVTTSNRFGIVFGSVIHYADLLVPSCNYAVDDSSNTSRFVIRSDEKTDIAGVYFFGFHVGLSWEVNWDILDSRKEISRTSRVISSRFFSFFARRSRVK